jgi:thiol-disulfide isomerase/thioredoxin
MKRMDLLILILVMSSLFLGGCINNANDDTPGNNSDDDTNDSNWLINYTPAHVVGTGPDDFWIEYPSGSDYYGNSVDHHDWVIDHIENKPVLFVVHRTGCLACKEQGDLVISLAEEYGDYVKFHDIDVVYDAPQDIHQMSNEAYVYDPNGAPGYIALTGVFTYVEDDNEIKIGWHSWELDVEDTVMETWVKDAIYYHNLNT